MSLVNLNPTEPNAASEQSADPLDVPLENISNQPQVSPAPSNPAYELGVWLAALPSFYKLQNHPLSQTETQPALQREWRSEVQISKSCLLHCAQLTLSLLTAQPSKGEQVNNGLEALDILETSERDTGFPVESVLALSGALGDSAQLCTLILETSPISFSSWATTGRAIQREVCNTDFARMLILRSRSLAASKLQAPLKSLSLNLPADTVPGSDVLQIFTRLTQLLEWLRLIEQKLRLDYPLKPALPIFTLIYSDARELLSLIEKRAMCAEGIDELTVETLDSANYAISMELRKVFSHELVGVSEMRQAPTIFARVENAHGLLRDCFQQSLVGLAQLFDPSIDGARLFETFQTKLGQSLALRSDLWSVLQLVRRAEKDRDAQPVGPLLDRLAQFQAGSLRYLMYKDWEACDRFIEEVSAARGAVELTPVLHRFAAFLETLHGQVNMRAVLANHPFDFPQEETLI